MRSLSFLDIGENHISSLNLPAGLVSLNSLAADANQLGRLTLPADLTNLTTALLNDNHLTNFFLPSGLTNLDVLDLSFNALTALSLPAGLTRLTQLDLEVNQLTRLTLPPDITLLNGFFVDGNPFTRLVLSEPLAATNLAGTVVFLRNQGVSVLTYPLVISVTAPRQAAGVFEFTLSGPPGIYTVLASTDLAVWSELGEATNTLGSLRFTDATAHLAPHKFYRARSAP